MLLDKKMNGIFYTPRQSARFLANRVLSHIDLTLNNVGSLEILDPMVGSGELLSAFCQEMLARFPEEEKKKLATSLPNMIYGTDKDPKAVDRTKYNIASVLSDLTGDYVEPDSFFNVVKVDALVIDGVEKAFPHIFDRDKPGFAITIANPPWEVVKVNDREFFSIYHPDYRRLSRDARVRKREVFLSDRSIRERYDEYRKEIADTKEYISKHYRLAKSPSEVNLYRVSLERILQLARMGGIIGVITPTGLAGDYGAGRLREELLINNKILEMWGFSIGAKLFPEVDVSPLFTIFSRGGRTDEFVYQSEINSIESAFSLLKENLPRIDRSFIVKLSPDDLTFTPISNEVEFGILKKMYCFPLVSNQACGSWNLDVGRELDETNDREYIIGQETPFRFLKGRDINPFRIKIRADRWVKENYPKLSQKSHEVERIVWRDIARSNKERRMFATIAPVNYVLGNSLNYFKESLTETKRRYLLGVWSSLLIEYRLRQLSTNNHFNMYVTRQIPIPRLEDDNPYLKEIQLVVDKLLKEYTEESICKLEALVASLYGLNRRELAYILSKFPKIGNRTKERIIEEFESIQIVQNHDTAALSELDIQMVKSVPEGGNWKDIPESIPSQRLRQIRENFKLGNGSRSTYYGRLDRMKPAYTISTHFYRPGNGCNIHPTQDRTLSAREAARLQSFPDWFRFFGKSKASIFRQIGNAVPPLLAYTVANTLPKGYVIDLFSGAGGMSLGFYLAGHIIFSAVDIEEDFVETYTANIPTTNKAIIGDLRNDETVNRLTAEVRDSGKEIDTVIGGPPCQGLSEAGNKRSKDDSRNNLYLRFIEVVKLLNPKHFVMENVPGLLTLEKGSFYLKLLHDFDELDYKIIPLFLWAHEFGVPQRRKRIFIVGVRDYEYQPPTPIFSLSPKSGLPKPVTVGDALANLPPIPPNSWLMKRSVEYSKPDSAYVRWLRGEITIEELLELYGAKLQASQRALGDYFQ
jgi:Alw26I/Eco31I/Esp3I family type II restriction m6 adenine DNA methyltransferase